MCLLVFNYEQVSRLNTTETYVYNYIVQNIKKVLAMSIRELADETHVSTATIMRFCKKLDCDGFVEFKYKLKQSLEIKEDLEEFDHLSVFFDYAKTKDYTKSIQRSVQLIKEASNIIIVGLGINGDFARYSARLFSHIGHYAYAIDDIHYPVLKTKENESSVVIVFYEESQEEVIYKVINAYHKYHYQVILIARGNVNKMEELCEVIIHISDDDLKFGEIYSRIPMIYTIENIANEIK